MHARSRSKPPVGHKFSLCCLLGSQVVGVAGLDAGNAAGPCGRPVSRALDDGRTLEVVRLCTDGTPNACSKLYSACWTCYGRASAPVVKAMGYEKLITYILAGEKGISLSAAGWRKEALTEGGSWNCTSRPRSDTAPTTPKIRYSISEQAQIDKKQGGKREKIEKL